METFIAILIGLAVITLTAVLFGGWLLVMLLRGVGRFIGWLLGVNRAEPAASMGPGRMRCPRARCHADNPDRSHYCRRCGLPMNRVAAARQVHPRRRAAML